MTAFALIKRSPRNARRLERRRPYDRRQVVQRDASARPADPTFTGALRSAFVNQIDQRARQLKAMTSDALVKHDMFALGKLTAQNVAFNASSDKLQAFADWLHIAMDATLLAQKGGWVGAYVGGGYKKGLDHARRETDQAIDIDPKRGNVLSVKAAIELQGIAAATEQHMNRAFAHGIMSKHVAGDIAAQTLDKIDSIAVKRALMLVDQSVVNAHAEASLDAMESLGITHVKLRGETCFVRDAKLEPSEKEAIAAIREEHSVARVPKRKPQNWRQYLRFRTAGDDLVCPICEELEDEVYLISEARGLIPVHIECRCAFVPHFDRRYAQDRMICEGVTS
jgi:hypothetical protein